MTDIAELFERDPLGYSQQDIDAIIAAFRRMREQHLVDPKSKAKKVEAAPPKNLSINDLL